MPSSPDLDHLFAARSIAVVGASNKTGKMGNLFMQRLAAAYQGVLYAINPNEAEVAGITTHASIANVPGQVDLLIALIPATRLIELVEACRPGQISFLLAIPSGFAEASAEGYLMQEQLVAAARHRGMRVLGPNIVGIMNGVLGLNASMMPELPPGGHGLSCVTQSGGFGMALSMFALDHNVPVAKFCDLGNMSDVQVHDVVDYLADDTDTKVLGLFLEAAGDHARFEAALKRAAAIKPVITVATGVSSAGQRASHAHLGIAQGIAAVEWPASVIHASTASDLLNAAKALLWQPAARGNRVAILTGTGGIGAELSDLAVNNGLDVPAFSPTLARRIRERLPYFAGCANPVDFTPIWADYAVLYPRVLDNLLTSGEVDAVIISITDVAASVTELAEALAQWGRTNRTLPVVIFWGARDRDRENMRVLEATGLPCYRTTREAVQSMAALVRGASRLPRA